MTWLLLSKAGVTSHFVAWCWTIGQWVACCRRATVLLQVTQCKPSGEICGSADFIDRTYRALPFKGITYTIKLVQIRSSKNVWVFINCLLQIQLILSTRNNRVVRKNLSVSNYLWLLQSDTASLYTCNRRTLWYDTVRLEGLTKRLLRKVSSHCST